MEDGAHGWGALGSGASGSNGMAAMLRADYAGRMSDLPRPPAPALDGFQPDPTADLTLVNVFDFERLAAERLPAGPLAYFAGGALDERTLDDNRAAFERWRFVPRVMTDVSAIDTSVSIFGRKWPFPVWICPTALQRMAHPEGELATARAAAARGLTMTLSTSASTDMADIAAVGGPRWYQASGQPRGNRPRAVGLTSAAPSRHPGSSAPIH